MKKKHMTKYLCFAHVIHTSNQQHDLRRDIFLFLLGCLSRQFLTILYSLRYSRIYFSTKFHHHPIILIVQAQQQLDKSQVPQLLTIRYYEGLEFLEILGCHSQGIFKIVIEKGYTTDNWLMLHLFLCVQSLMYCTLYK